MIYTFTIVKLDDWTRGESEPGGDEAKRWFIAPSSSTYAGHWLFKPHRVKTLPLSKERQRRNDEPDVLVRGEDWAEKISYELAKLLDIPAAITEIATVIQPDTQEHIRGSMSRDIRPSNWVLNPGAALLAENEATFDAQSCHGHTLTAIYKALEGLRGPIESDYADWMAFDVFASYLLLDAWIANTDRHAHNWGVLQNPSDGSLCLGPSFDHGSALASGDGDNVRARHASEETIEHWCNRGQTKRFNGGQAINLVDIAAKALSLCKAETQQYWLTKITGVDLDACFDIVDAVPYLSEPTRIFLKVTLKINRKRLCDAFC